jgi:hypothetical protein
MQTKAQAFTYHTLYVPHVGAKSRAGNLWFLPLVVIVPILLIRRPRRALAIVYVAFAVLVALGMFRFERMWDRSVSYAAGRAARAAADSSTPVVEGQVENFKPAPAEGHQDETFTVKGVRFAYSDYVITGGFNQTQSHGGPIREGLPVRIHYLPPSNLIVKLEVAN